MSRRRVTTTVHQPDPDSPFASGADGFDADEFDQREAAAGDDSQEVSEALDPDGVAALDAVADALDRAEAGTTEAPAAKTPAEMAEVLGKALVQQARDAADVEATERVYAGVPTATPATPRAPRTGHLPFGDTRFDAAAAVRTIGDIAVEIEQLKAEWDHQKSLAADAKKAYDDRVESLLKIIDRLRTEQIRAVHQPTLREVDDVASAPARTSCPWEQAHPGQRCAICADREQRRTEAPGADSPEHPQHAEHEAAAEARRADELARLKQGLIARTFYIADAELDVLPEADLRTLVAWAQSPGVLPPPLMLRACIAAAVDPDSGQVQTCTRCGRQLWARDVDLHQAGLAPYTANALVGLDCQGVALDGDGQPVAEAPVEGPEPVATAAPEPARKPAKRGTRAKTQKHDPDAERTEQVKAGRRRKAEAGQ